MILLKTNNLTAQRFVKLEGYLLVEFRAGFHHGGYSGTSVDIFFFEELSEALHNAEAALAITYEKSLWFYRPEVCTEFYHLTDKVLDKFGDSILNHKLENIVSENYNYLNSILLQLRSLDYREKMAERKKQYALFKIKANVVSGQYYKKTTGICHIEPYKEPKDTAIPILAQAKLGIENCPYYYYDESFEEITYLFSIFK